MSLKTALTTWLSGVRSYDLLLKTYVLPIFAVMVAIQANWLIAPRISVLPPYLMFLGAIMVTAWYAGFSPAMFAIAFSALAIDYFFIAPYYSFSIETAELAVVAFFVVEGMGVAYCINHVRENQQKLRRSNMALQRDVDTERAHFRRKEETLRELVSEMALTGERQREQLALELHDHLAQLLALSKIKLDLAQRQLDRSVTESQRHISATEELLERSLHYVRTLMAELHPIELKQSGLPAALRSLATHMAQHDLTVDVYIATELATLPANDALVLYQSARELLMNVVKHAAVTIASVSLEAHANQLVLTVRDTGHGFDATAPISHSGGHHWGLSSIKKRMAALGGTLLIESALGHGTTMILRVPVSPLHSEILMAAQSVQQDRVILKPIGLPNQESLPL